LLLIVKSIAEYTFIQIIAILNISLILYKDNILSININEIRSLFDTFYKFGPTVSLEDAVNSRNPATNK